MADPISVQCPHCKVKLKLKAAPPAGKKVGCPKCKKPFPVKAPPKKKESDDDFLDALDDLSEDDYEAPEDEDSQDEEEERPARSTLRAKSGGSTKKSSKGKKGRSKKSSAGPVLAIIGGSVLALALVGGLAYLLMSLSGGAKGIRSASGEFIAFLPADAEMYFTARPADIMALPLLAPVFQNPQAKAAVADFEKSFGFPVTEVEHAFVAVANNLNAVGAAQPAAAQPAAGNPMMAMPGFPMMPGALGASSNSTQDLVCVLRLKQPYGGKTSSQFTQQFPPKTHSGVTYHTNSNDAFFFCDDRHVVVTRTSWVERVIDRKDQAESSEVLGYLAKEQHLTVVATQKGNAAQSSLPPELSRALPNPELQKMVQEVSKVRLDVNVPAGVDVKVALTCKSDSAAQQFHGELTKQIDQLKQMAEFLKASMPEIDSVINTLQVNVSGTTMNLAVSVPSALIDRLKQMGPTPGVSSPGLGAPGQSPGAFPPGVPTTGAALPGTAPVVAPPGAAPRQN